MTPADGLSYIQLYVRQKILVGTKAEKMTAGSQSSIGRQPRRKFLCASLLLRQSGFCRRVLRGAGLVLEGDCQLRMSP